MCNRSLNHTCSPPRVLSCSTQELDPPWSHALGEKLFISLELASSGGGVSSCYQPSKVGNQDILKRRKEERTTLYAHVYDACPQLYKATSGNFLSSVTMTLYHIKVSHFTLESNKGLVHVPALLAFFTYRSKEVLK